MKTQIRNLLLTLPVFAMLLMTGCAACRYGCVAALEIACLADECCSDYEDDCDVQVFVVPVPEPMPSHRTDVHHGWKGDREPKHPQSSYDDHTNEPKKKSENKPDSRGSDSGRRSFGRR